MIYRDHSVPFFGGDYKVLRGGSWAVAPSTIRPSFRNWDYPVRRQIFAGVRMARDAWVCRHLAWLGPPRRLSELLLEAGHGLIVQSYAPRRRVARAGLLAVEPAAVDGLLVRVRGPGGRLLVRAGGGPVGHGRDAAG